MAKQIFLVLSLAIISIGVVSSRDFFIDHEERKESFTKWKTINKDPVWEIMTDKQVVAAVKLVRNMCLGKAKTTPEEVERMHKGDWNVDHNAKCYMWCSLNMYKLIDKENHFDRKSADVQLAQLPEHMQEYVIRCIDKCEHAATNLDDKCEAAWEYSKCMYFCEPEKYFLP